MEHIKSRIESPQVLLETSNLQEIPAKEDKDQLKGYSSRITNNENDLLFTKMTWNSSKNKHVTLKLDLNIKNNKMFEKVKRRDLISKKIYTNNNTSIVENLKKVSIPTQDIPDIRVSKYDDYLNVGNGLHDYGITKFLNAKINGRRAFSSKNIHSIGKDGKELSLEPVSEEEKSKSKDSGSNMRRKKIKDIKLEDVAPPKNAFYKQFFINPNGYYKNSPKICVPKMYEIYKSSTKMKAEHFNNILKDSKVRPSIRVKDIPLLPDKGHNSLLFVTNPNLSKKFNNEALRLKIKKEAQVNTQECIDLTKNFKTIKQNSFTMNMNVDETVFHNQGTNYSKKTESVFVKSSKNIIASSHELPMQDKVYNIMHKKRDEIRVMSTNEVIEKNKNIKFIMYKNDQKDLKKINLLYDDFIKSPSSFRSKSMHGILKLDKDYQRYKNKEKELLKRIHL